jgi:small subunit ribosomal protein S9
MSTDAIFATGRRKTAVARVILKPGTGTIVVNDRAFEEYFPSLDLQNVVLAPLQLTDTSKRFDVTINTHGGGPNGQVGAARLGISRALCVLDKEMRPKLKAAGFLTRDPRMKERKKSGRPGARKRFQFSKR